MPQTLAAPAAELSYAGDGMRSLDALPAPFALVPAGSSTRVFYQADCLHVLARLEPGSVDVVVTSPPYNLGVRYRSVRRHLAAQRLPALDRRWIAAVARVLAPDGSLFLNVGAKPTDPWAGLDVAQVGAARISRSRTRSTGSSRSPSTRTRPAAPRLIATWRSATTSRSTATGSSTTATSSSSTSPTTGGRGSIAQAIGVPYQDKSNVTRWRAAPRRPPLPRQHLVPAVRDDQEPGYAIARIRRRSRRACLSSASGSTAASARGSCSTRSPASAPRPSPAPASGSTSSRSTWTRSISVKRSSRHGHRGREPRLTTPARGRRIPQVTIS